MRTNTDPKFFSGLNMTMSCPLLATRGLSCKMASKNEDKAVVIAKTASELQRMRLDKLMKNPVSRQ